jgi:ribosome-associated protein
MTDLNMTDANLTDPHAVDTTVDSIVTPPHISSMTDLEMLKLIVDAAEDRRAENVVALDLSKVSSSLEYFVICTATAGLQINAVVSNVRGKMAEAGLKIRGVEGPSDRWTLMNFGSTVVHVMTQEAREYYDLEGLWNDAEILKL